MKIKLKINDKAVQDTAQGVGKTAKRKFKLSFSDITSVEDIDLTKKILEAVSI